MNSKDLEYKAYSLSDIYVVELLISYRYKYDDYMFLKAENNPIAANDKGISEEVMLTYIALDEYIKKCNFNEQQLTMIKMIGEGYSHKEIAEELNLKLSVISGRLKTIYKKIVRENEWQWRKFVYTSKLGLKTKTCSKCNEDLPAVREFYSDLETTKDGFHSQCKKCKN